MTARDELRAVAAHFDALVIGIDNRGNPPGAEYDRKRYADTAAALRTLARRIDEEEAVAAERANDLAVSECGRYMFAHIGALISRLDAPLDADLEGDAR
jgi:hypothetical protein